MAGTEGNTDGLNHVTLHRSSQENVINHQDHVTLQQDHVTVHQDHVTLPSQPWHIPEYSDQDKEP